MLIEHRVLVLHEFIIVKDPTIKKKLRGVAVDQDYVEEEPILIVVCSNTLVLRSGTADEGGSFIVS
jgi:hypothetical protein